ncbi:uncharacterized protein LOC129914455 [Episyrphus balteatus]|uniref:uncharacterized protein LOC129914455 n=1 Tax=Episyrphus balteatus TaxID=286459 RepID=UPI00248524C2|nr:uncharacterized protein LOC129914455 [Episyrphus balteatus]
MSSKKLTSRNEIDDMEKLAILLSLPHKNTYNALPEVERPAGLPINALPGWESIPLHSKLPMLKCPNNQVIFTKNKIGRSYENSQRDFDSVCLNAKMDYNPLHDPHLGRFYSNEKLLKRLRENGEITENNDVICTLKEFNEHRIPLHETYLSLIRSQRNKMSEEQQDIHMISHAEQIAEREKKLTEKSLKGTNYFGDISTRKAEISQKRAQRNQAIVERICEKEQKIELHKNLQEEVWRHKKELNNFRIKHILDVGIDIQRKRLIALKKHLQYKSDRLKRNIKSIKETSMKMAEEKAELSWEMHLQERIMKHEKLKQITKENENDMKEWIENHRVQYQQKWNEIQQQLENRCRRGHHSENVTRKKRLIKKIRCSLEKSNEDDLKNLTSQDIHDALQTAIDLENPQKLQHFDSDDYIFKAAKYILEDILAKFDKDLTCEKEIEYVLSNRINKLFTNVKQYVLKRATHIISTDRVSTGSRSISFLSTRTKRYSLAKGVSFNSFSTLIGTGSYALNEGGVKLTTGRPPTPAGSLTSVVIDPDDDDNEDDNANNLTKKRKSLHQLSRDQRIFVEHLFIKFKRELIVGVGKQVMAAIECHKKNKILRVRKELQDIDKQFLVKLMTRSILSYAINNCNFHSNILLCQYALAGDIILLLQKGLLKPKRDPRVIVQPRSRCVCVLAPPFSTYCR